VHYATVSRRRETPNVRIANQDALSINFNIWSKLKGKQAVEKPPFTLREPQGERCGASID
jgi:hypothetical protein